MILAYDHASYQAQWRAANRDRTAEYRETHRAKKRLYDRAYYARYIANVARPEEVKGERSKLYGR